MAGVERLTTFSRYWGVWPGFGTVACAWAIVDAPEHTKTAKSIVGIFTLDLLDVLGDQVSAFCDANTVLYCTYTKITSKYLTPPRVGRLHERAGTYALCDHSSGLSFSVRCVSSSILF